MYTSQNMHFIQQAIIKSLAVRESARYSEIKPKTMESNHFIYHLKQLIKDKLVAKNDDGSYSISPKGEAFIDGVSFSSFKVRSQPNVLNLMVCKSFDGKYLLYKRKHRPFIGLKGFPYGKIHLGNSLRESCKLELIEQTGIDTTFDHAGDVYITVFKGDTLVSHTLFHVHTAIMHISILTSSPPYGQFTWETVDETKSQEYFHGFTEVLALTNDKTKKDFFEELVFRDQL
jgi:ADP-ribose pyrophosphatase YjhB (NUDIX family)